jgi:ATP-dependent DNA helicase RecG
VAFIRRNLPDKFHLEGIQRIDIRNIIFREIAANMLIHREFLHTFPAKFLIFSDRVITENWTKPYGKNPITLENLETHPKNPNIAHVFREMGWGEQLGSGRKNILKYAPYYYSNYQITIENEEKFVFEITYRGDDNINEKINNTIVPENQKNKIYILIDEKINASNENINEDIKNQLYSIINFLYHQPNQNRIDLIEQSKKGRASVDRYIKILKDANIIELRGSRKIGGYYLTQKAMDALS